MSSSSSPLEASAATHEVPHPPAVGAVQNDLGFGTRVAEQSKQRYINRDGSFNVRRLGLRYFQSMTAYHALLTVSWPKFQLIVAGTYLVTNLIFAVGFVLCGPGALRGAEGSTTAERFWEAFFFSVQTLATIGYGHMSPRSMTANFLVSIEALLGLLGFALITGMLFARFSRPVAKILYSEKAIIAPFQGETAFMFRIANQLSNQLINVEAFVSFSRWVYENGRKVRRFHELKLERPKVMFFPLHWVVVHPIAADSPMRGLTQADLENSDAEFVIMLTGVDELFAQSVHSRMSYKHDEVVWGAKYRDMFRGIEDGVISIDMSEIHSFDRIPL
ncbi:MAG: ion channel [Bryobacteraceae bacterium]